LRYEHWARGWEKVTLDLAYAFQVFDLAASVLQVINIEMALEGMVRTVLKEEVGVLAAVDLRMGRVSLQKGLEEKVGDKTKSFSIRLKNIELMEVFE